MRSIERCHFQWLWVTVDPGFKDTVVLKGEYLQNDAFYRHSYYRTLIENHRQAIELCHFRCPWRPWVTRDPDFKRRAGLSATAGLSCYLYIQQWRQSIFQDLEHKGFNQLFGVPSLPFPPHLSLPPCPLLLEVGPYLPSLSLPFLSFRSRAPKIQLGDLRVRCELPAGSGAESQPKSNLVHFSLKIWHLVATISIIFLRINWPNLVHFKHSAKTKSCFMGYPCGFVGQYRLHIKGNLLKCKWKWPRTVLS